MVDLPECQVLLEGLNLPYPGASWRALPEIWRTFLFEGTMQLFVVENRAAPVGSRIVSFGASLFVTDGFCAEAQSTLAPYLGPQVVRQYLAGGSPILSSAHVAQANGSEGLNVMMCFDGARHDGLSSEEILAVREKQSEAFRVALSGYRMKEFLADAIGEERLQWLLDAGARRRRNYSNCFRKHGLPSPGSLRRPNLVGLTREEARAHPGTQIASLFVYALPRFRFKRSEQVLLQHALTGATCEGLASSLFISPWTVKKRWRSIYERVAEVDRELLPRIDNGTHATSRGAERLRPLLNYLRQHAEELRPLSRTL